MCAFEFFKCVYVIKEKKMEKKSTADFDVLSLVASSDLYPFI